MCATTPSPLIGTARLLHTMLRVGNLEVALDFYVGKLGMQLLRRQDFMEQRYTLAFVGYGGEATISVLELTHNWDTSKYVRGDAFGHLAIGVADIYAAVTALADAGVRVTRPAGPLKGDENEVIAFVEDPDGYKIELIEKASDWLAHTQGRVDAPVSFID